jgi:hypothetical protein
LRTVSSAWQFLSTLTVVLMKCLVCIGLVLAALGLLATGPARAAGRVDIELSIRPDGVGRLSAETSSTTAPPFTWEVCAADLKGCKRFAGGRRVETTGAPAGSVFRVKGARGETGVSPEWRGPPKALTPPSVAGVVQANQFVSPVRGLWSGGWAGEDSELQLAACSTAAAAAEECVALTDPHYYRGGGCTAGNSFALGGFYAGRYLRVANRQSGGPHTELPYSVGPAPPHYEVAHLLPGPEVWKRSRNTSVAIVGQIAPAAGPPAGECGPPPAPIATISAAGVARVECGGGCSVALIGTRKGRRQSMTSQIHESSLLAPWAPLEMRLPRAALARLGAGKVRLTVQIDGTPWARRTIPSATS